MTHDTTTRPRIAVDLLVMAALVVGLVGCAWLCWWLVASTGTQDPSPPSLADGSAAAATSPSRDGSDATPEVGASRPRLTLPDDADELSLHPHRSLATIGHDALRLRVDRIPVPVRIVVRRGAIFGSDDPLTSPRVAATEVAVDVDHAGTLTVPTLILDPTRAVADSPLELPAELASPPVLAWLEASAAERWSVRQTGLWMLVADVSPEAFGALRIARANLFAPELSTSSRIAGYGEISRAARLLAGATGDPSRFALYRHVREHRDQLVAHASIDSPGKNAESVLVNKALRPYAAEPDVVALLLRYLERDEPAHVVTAAFEMLVEAGMPETSSDELYQALAEDRLANQRQRFLYALLLYNRLDPRGLPLFVAFESSASLFAPYAKAVARRIDLERKEDEVGRGSGESLFDYYARGASGGLRTDRAVVELARRLHDAPDEILARALADLASGDARRMRAGLSVAVRYTASPAAFEAVAARALDGTQPGVSNEALEALPRFSSHALGSVYEKLVASLVDANRAGFAMSSLARAQFPERDALLEAALAHGLPVVRLRALHAMGDARIEVRAEVVLGLSERDPSIEVRVEALERLAKIQYAPLLTRLEAWLAAKTPREKRAGLSAARGFGAYPKARALPEPYREDPVIGKDVVKHLDRVARRR